MEMDSVWFFVRLDEEGRKAGLGVYLIKGERNSCGLEDKP
jgi:hypothetical protein